MTEVTDPYIISDQTVRQHPDSLIDRFRFLGPGFILSASIVGSGELIATTVLGAKAGFAALWIIIVSCLAKVALQLEFGRHAILTGETAAQAFNKLPGIKLGEARWPVWTLLFLQLLKIVQIGGIIGSAAVVFHLLFPILPIALCTFLTAAIVASLIYNGKYGRVEKGSLLMIAIFSVLTVVSLIMLQFTDYAFSTTDVISGFRFRLSPEEIGFAIGAFGITGVASDEIIAYNYWCIEKGYASYAGPPDHTDAWKQRAQGWINVMYLDAVVAMIIYTGVTVTFYLLGAAILHGYEIVPHGNQVVETLALIYTQSLGPEVRTIYLVGAFFVLFSSLYATLAAWTRFFPDVFGQLGWLRFSDRKQRKRMVSILAVAFPVLWTGMYLFIELPVLMVLSGGIVGSVMLLVVVLAGWHFKYKRGQVLQTGWFYTLIFWISIFSILMVSLYGLLQVLT